MKVLLVVALTTVLIGYTSVGGDRGVPQGGSSVPQGGNRVPQDRNKVPQDRNRVPHDDSSRSQEEDTDPRGPPKDACTLASSLVFKTNVTLSESNCNKTFNANEFIQVPQVQWTDAKEDTHYTFLLISTHPKFEDNSITERYTDVNYFQWGISNIPGSELRSNGNIENHHRLAGRYQYGTSYPAVGTPQSCLFIALIYQQTAQIPTTVRIDPFERHMFNAKKFAKDQGLSGPVAALQAWINPAEPYF